MVYFFSHFIITHCRMKQKAIDTLTKSFMIDYAVINPHRILYTLTTIQVCNLFSQPAAASAAFPYSYYMNNIKLKELCYTPNVNIGNHRKFLSGADDGRETCEGAEPKFGIVVAFS